MADVDTSRAGVAGLQQDGAPTAEPFSVLFNKDATLAAFFSAMFTAALAIGATLAVLRLGYAGFMYMTSDVWGNKHHATEIIQQAVLGLLLLLAVYLILFQINPDILNLDILQSIKNSTAGTPSISQ